MKWTFFLICCCILLRLSCWKIPDSEVSGELFWSLTLSFEPSISQCVSKPINKIRKGENSIENWNWKVASGKIEAISEVYWIRAPKSIFLKAATPEFLAGKNGWYCASINGKWNQDAEYKLPIKQRRRRRKPFLSTLHSKFWHRQPQIVWYGILWNFIDFSHIADWMPTKCVYSLKRQPHHGPFL